MPQLLVSVVSPLEAEEALAGGADLIDVKDPSRGPLGRADDAVMIAIRDRVAGRRPLSAALGESSDHPLSPPIGFNFIKCGLAGLGGDGAWPRYTARLRESTAARFVHVAYADWECARAPSVDNVVAHALLEQDAIVLIDTCCKDATAFGHRPTLLDWLPLSELSRLIATVHDAKARIALAGSLGPEEIAQVAPLSPDWIAVRAAACDSSRRDGIVTRAAVAGLKSLLSVFDSNGVESENWVR